MSIKEKYNSIQFRMSLALSASIMLIVFIIVIINNASSGLLYTYQKVKVAENVRNSINTYYNGITPYDIDQNLRDLEIKNNFQILIEDTDKNVVFAGNKNILSSIEKLENVTTEKRKLYEKNGIEIFEVQEANSKFILLTSTLDNGYNLFIKIPTSPIKEAAKISSRTLISIGILMIVVSIIISSFISRRFTKPIIQLNRITKKMANLDFSEKYRITDGEDEVNELGKNINQMSDKLEMTIEQLRRNNNQLEKDIEKKSKIEKMRKQFISDVSHELKTPIALIQGYAEGLYDNVNSDEESRKFYAEVIIDESKKMDKLVKELLELMKLENEGRKFNDSKFNLNEVIEEELRRETVVLKEKNIKVEFENNKPMMVTADQEYIEQVVNNYLTNAIKHCEGENKIIIRCEKTKQKKIRLYVFNTGKQIPEENLDKIWQRFYKVDSSRNREDGGTGIGLALVKAIMNSYGNKYGVENKKDGVEFFCDINQ